MNESLQTAIEKLLLKTVDGVDSATTFLSNEIPDYISQLLMWHAVSSALICTVSLLITIVWVRWGILKPYQLIKRAEATKCGNALVKICRDDSSELRGFAGILWLNIFLFIPILVIFHHLDWLKILIAPKVWLIEYAATLVK